MYKLVPHSMPAVLGDESPCCIVDIQLVGDALAGDNTFTCDRSVLKDPIRHVYTYTALRDAISPNELAHIRRFIVFVLSKLAHDLQFMCFKSGGLPAEDTDLFENRIEYSGYHGGAGINGSITIVELNTDDLESIVDYWGNFDSVRGVALTGGGIRGMQADLRLFEPMPTTDGNTYFQSPRFNALRTALKHGEFFFEEIGNGTRLRLVCNKFKQDEFVRMVQLLIEKFEGRP